MITHEEYIKTNLTVESLIDKVNDSTPHDSEIMKKFIAASNIVESYEEVHFPVGLPSLTDVVRLRMSEMKLKKKTWLCCLAPPLPASTNI